MSTPFRAVIFDLGGVVLGSPLHAIADYERRARHPRGPREPGRRRAGAQGAWARLERGELGLEAFVPAFERECAEAGHAISAREMMLRIGAASAPRPAMLRAIAALRRGGLAVAALTNNWESDGEPRPQDELRAHFDAFVESRVIGLRKPDPRIYLLRLRGSSACARRRRSSSTTSAAT